MTQPSRISRRVILTQLKLAARRGDRTALVLAADQMRTWAYSPRYWDRYLELLAYPLARLVDMTLIKQGEKIARQKGWVRPKRAPRPKAKPAGRRAGGAKGGRRRRSGVPADQPTLFPDLY